MFLEKTAVLKHIKSQLAPNSEGGTLHWHLNLPCLKGPLLEKESYEEIQVVDSQGIGHDVPTLEEKGHGQ